MNALPSPMRVRYAPDFNMFYQYQIIKLAKDLNPILQKGMQGVILEVWDNETFEIEFVKNDGSNYGYNGNFTFTVKADQITECIQ